MVGTICSGKRVLSFRLGVFLACFLLVLLSIVAVEQVAACDNLEAAKDHGGCTAMLYGMRRVELRGGSLLCNKSRVLEKRRMG